MLKRSFFRSLFFFPLTLAVLLFSTYIWYPSPLITPLKAVGFADMTEIVVAILLVAYCSLLLPNRYEIELSLTCGVKTAKLAFCRLLPVLVDTLAALYVILAFYRYTPYDGRERPHIPIVIPEHMKAYLAVSLFVTTLFFTALYFFFRVLTRNCYIPVVICMFIEAVFGGLCKDIQAGNVALTRCRFDPFISVYMISDKLPNALAEQYADLSVLSHAWTYNRILFFVLALLLFGAAYLVLRREHLHQGFGE